MKEAELQFYFFRRYIFLLILIFYSCTNSKTTEHSLDASSSDKDILHLNTRTFKPSDLFLSDIADDIKYIHLDNSLPVGQIESLNIRNNCIYLNIDGTEATYLIRFDIDGKNPLPIGKAGRGPGEYLSCTSYSVDNKTGNIYVLGKRETVMVYSPNGVFRREFQLPHSDGHSIFHDIEFLNSFLFFAQYISMGQAQFKWIITDTLGNMLSQKQNYLPSFVSQTGSFGGINKFEDKISWWDMYNDSVFTIAPDFSYRLSGLFPPGIYRRSHDEIIFSSPQEYIDEESKICTTLKFFESNNYWIYMYRYNLYGIAFIDKRNRETKSGLTELKSWGIKNDLDGGPIFLPKGYYNRNGVEYLVGVVNSYQLIKQIGSKEFRNSKPKYPDKKKELAKFTLGLNENDNPIIMLVKLKK